MKRGPTMLLGGLFIWVLALILINRQPPAKTAQTSTAEPAGASHSEEDLAREQAAYERETQARIQELARLQNERRAQEELEAKTIQARTALQQASSDAWAALL